MLGVGAHHRDDQRADAESNQAILVVFIVEYHATQREAHLRLHLNVGGEDAHHLEQPLETALCHNRWRNRGAHAHEHRQQHGRASLQERGAATDAHRRQNALDAVRRDDRVCRVECVVIDGVQHEARALLSDLVIAVHPHGPEQKCDAARVAKQSSALVVARNASFVVVVAVVALLLAVAVVIFAFVVAVIIVQ